MKNKTINVFSILFMLSFIVSSCGVLSDVTANKVQVQILYGSEKKEWLTPLVEEFNNAKNKTAEGKIINIEAIAIGSIESVNAIINEEMKPVVWSPASSVYIPIANDMWQTKHSSDLVAGNPKDLVLSPVVIAMWEPMARALGWPDKQLGWKDVADFAISENGWSDYGYPEWGSFKFGHTHPEYSNSGFVSIIAEAYAGAGLQRGLTEEIIASQEVRTFMADVEKSIIHYGSSTGFFGERMFERGPSYLSAAVLYENLIVAQETKRLMGQSQQLPVVAIYPKEGTFWSNHPYVILNAPWVTAEQKEAAQLFEAFLLDRPQQLKAIQLGFRPADPSIPLSAPLDVSHGVDVSQPQTVLEIPDASVLTAIQSLWKEVKKPVDLVIVMDISGSMSGEKINTARTSLMDFLRRLDNRDRVQIILFNSDLRNMTELSELGEKRDNLLNRVSGITEESGTRMFDAILMALDELSMNGNPNHIRSIVVLSDGVDTESVIPFDEFMTAINTAGKEGGTSIKVMTIAFGSDADTEILEQISVVTGGKMFKADPSSIQKVYSEIATFY